ncbi:MAG: type IV secretory system conjugative DNA transfer family protein [Candidatus Thorarchaeota archaeon]
MRSNRKDKSKLQYSSFLEGLYFKPISSLTNYILSLRNNSDIPQDSISLGKSPNQFNQKKIEEVYLSLKQLEKHAYILGQSGSGKTYLILLMLMSFVRLQSGFAVVDIHGDLSRMIFKYIASQATTPKQEAMIAKKLVLVEPFDKQFAPAFNPLSCSNSSNSYAEAFDMLGIFKNIWKDVSWGARMEELFRNLLLTLSLSKRSLVEAPLFLTDETFRSHIVDRLQDYEIKHYWTDRFGILSDRMRPVYVEPVLNKLTVFTSDPLIRHILAQKESSLDFRKMMDEQKWVIINISKGVLSDNSHLLGSLFISKIKSAALSRANIPESRRVPFHLVVDEFQNFMGYNFEEILSEARKYKLSLLLAHQNLAQIDKSMRETIFGNVATTMFFKLGHNDIREISNNFRTGDQTLLKQALSTLDVAEAIHRMSDGSFKKIKIHHINPFKEDRKVTNRLRQQCWNNYYKRRSVIDAELRLARTSNSTATMVLATKPKVTVKPRTVPNGGIGEGIL